MIIIFVILDWLILFFQTQCLPVQCPEGAAYVHKLMPQTLDGLELSLWHPEHMRVCHYSLWGMVSHQHVSQGKFHQKLKEVACHLKQLEPYTAPFPDDVLKIGHHFGPSIDVGPAMTAKILTGNGQVFHRST